MFLRRAAAAMAPKLLPGRNSAVVAGGAGASFSQLVTNGTTTCVGDLALASQRAIIRSVTTSSSVLDKKAGDSPTDDDGGAAARRAAAEKEAAKLVERWSSPLFSHVTVEVDDDRVIPRWANVVFVAVVVGVFGYCAHFAYNNENRKAQVKEEARLEREMRARSAIDSGALRDHGRRNFASETETSDPFDGMSPEEIENLAARERAAAGGGVGGGGGNAGNGGGR